jgi:hypothetical protein
MADSSQSLILDIEPLQEEEDQIIFDDDAVLLTLICRPSNIAISWHAFRDLDPYSQSRIPMNRSATVCLFDCWSEVHDGLIRPDGLVLAVYHYPQTDPFWVFPNIAGYSFNELLHCSRSKDSIILRGCRIGVINSIKYREVRPTMMPKRRFRDGFDTDVKMLLVPFFPSGLFCGDLFFESFF